MGGRTATTRRPVMLHPWTGGFPRPLRRAGGPVRRPVPSGAGRAFHGPFREDVEGLAPAVGAALDAERGGRGEGLLLEALADLLDEAVDALRRGGAVLFDDEAGLGLVGGCDVACGEDV